MNRAKEASLVLKPVHTLSGHESLINTCSFSKDGGLVVSSSADGTVRLWHTQSGEQLANFKGHWGTMVQSCAFVPNPKAIAKHLEAMHSSDSECELGPRIADIESSGDSLESFSEFSEEEDDQPLIISASDEDVKVWGALDGKEKASMLIDCDGLLQGFALSPDGQKMLTNMDDQCIILSTIDEDSRAVRLKGHEGAAKSFCFSEDGTQILTSSTDGSVKLWDSENGNEIITCQGHTESVWKAVFSPDGSSILSCSADKTLRVWDRSSGKEEAVMEGHKSAIHLCAYSPNGRWIASADKEKEIIVWDSNVNGADHKSPISLKGHDSFIWNIQFSPDSMLLLSTSSDGAMLLWAMPHGQLVASLRGHEDGVKSCSFSPRGDALVSSSHDNSLMLWNISGCYFEAYLQVMKSFFDSRTKNQFPGAICQIMAEYAWPDCVSELEIEMEYKPQVEEVKETSLKPAPRRRVKSCKF